PPPPWRYPLSLHDALPISLLLIVVADLDKSAERKIFAQRMALKAVVRQQPPHVRMAGENHAIEIVGLALEPVGTGNNLDDRGHQDRKSTRLNSSHQIISYA